MLAMSPAEGGGRRQRLAVRYRTRAPATCPVSRCDVAMSYLNLTLEHFLAVQQWQRDVGARAQVDTDSLQLTVQHEGRHAQLHARFTGLHQGQMVYFDTLVPQINGFAGWLPYRPFRWPLSTHKLRFKEAAAAAGLRVPAAWAVDDADAVPGHQAVVIKSVQGSFGYGMSGPLRAATRDKVGAWGRTTPSPAQPSQVTRHGDVPTSFLEAFVEGRNLKVWFWGAQPCHAHLHDWADVQGDGRTPIVELVDRTPLGAAARADDRELMTQCLAYQHMDWADVPRAGARVWVDFRYGRRSQPWPRQRDQDNAIPGLPVGLRLQIEHAGRSVAAELARDLDVPVLISLDGVVDGEDRVWWLEMNSAPAVPPTAYPCILDTLFDAPARRSALARTSHGEARRPEPDSEPAANQLSWGRVS